MTAPNDPSLQSFIPVSSESDFPIQNLPYGIFRRQGEAEPHVGVAIGDHILDLAVLEKHGLFQGSQLRSHRVFESPSLNQFLALGREAWQEARARVSELLSSNSDTLRDNATLKEHAIVSQSDVTMLLPVEIGDYTDFYSSKEHATNVGSMFRGPDNALMPNWLHLPVAYHGRASSVILSGTDLHRPHGQRRPAKEGEQPLFGPSRSMDFELEVGYFIGPGNDLGQPIPVGRAEDHLFGLVLVNDWSARDIQAWEYQPLGPFLAKSVGTSISPWVVTLEALQPFRVEGPRQSPEPLPYLATTGPMAYDIQLEVSLRGEKMTEPHVICRSNFKHMYWSMAQHIAHHTINGCNLRPGDLLASGTVSGPDPDSYGSMLELAWRGEKPIPFPNGETRSFLEDGDQVTMRGWCEAPGKARIGFGEVTTTLLSAIHL